MNNLFVSSQTNKRLDWWLGIMIFTAVLLSVPTPRTIQLSGGVSFGDFQMLLSQPAVGIALQLIKLAGEFLMAFLFLRTFGREMPRLRPLLYMLLIFVCLTDILSLVGTIIIGNDLTLEQSLNGVLLGFTATQALVHIVLLAIMVVLSILLIRRCGGRLHRLGVVMAFAVALPVIFGMIVFVLQTAGQQLMDWIFYVTLALTLLMRVWVYWAARYSFVPKWK